jgi:SNF2 family DNA or RNA helicase
MQQRSNVKHGEVRNKADKGCIIEAQMIKNKETQASKGCAKLQSVYRLCLSGTPMQNSCDE